jgi:ubiquitin-conjugating enzyme E2 O
MPGGRPAPLVDVPASELIYVAVPTEEDLVIYRDWVGRVNAITNMLRVQLADKCVVEIGDVAGENADGSDGAFQVGDIVKSKKSSLRLGSWIYGQYNPNTPPVGTVVSIRTIGAEIVWLERRIRSDQIEPPAILEVSEIESADFQVYDRTNCPSQTTSSVSALPGTASNSEPDVRLNLRVRFRDIAAAQIKYPSLPWSDRIATYGYDLNVFDVTKFRTDVTVQWQDLSITYENSIDVVPDTDIDDEHGAWPGEIAHTLGMRPVEGEPAFEQPERVGVVQTVNSADRLATVLWSPDAFAYFTKATEDESGHSHLISHSIPAFSGKGEELSLYDLVTSPALNVRRGDIVLIDSSALNPTSASLDPPRDVSWLGEIVDTLLSGSLVIRLGASHQVRDVVLNRKEVLVAVRSDGTAQVDEWDENDMDEGSDEGSYTDDDEWDEEDEDLPVRYEDEHGEPMDEEEVENEDWESADGAGDSDSGDAEMFDAPEQQPPIIHSDTPTEPVTPKPSIVESTQAPPAYLILEDNVPVDHHFHNQPPTDTPVHLKRTLKEHKILRTSSALPDGVYIRTWENRMDLLRFLIIGPTETPYANAPFVLDVYLPSEFPTKPPQVFFHSWPAHTRIGGTGRVNPNLYEDGTVCLSLLGTWTGNSVEEWSASRSTLLQVVVSLLGLVLVRSPYYNEAGYEGLVGTEESKRPSALYSERVFLRAKGFLITALSQPNTSGLAGLQDVIKWVYRDLQGPKLLDATTKEVEKTLENSQGGTELDGLTVMSKGACTSLSRVLETLKGLHQRTRL